MNTLRVTFVSGQMVDVTPDLLPTLLPSFMVIGIASITPIGDTSPMPVIQSAVQAKVQRKYVYDADDTSKNKPVRYVITHLEYNGKGHVPVQDGGFTWLKITPSLKGDNITRERFKREMGARWTDKYVSKEDGGEWWIPAHVTAEQVSLCLNGV